VSKRFVVWFTGLSGAGKSTIAFTRPEVARVLLEATREEATA
jgi:adenylylsulfate kinase-like enzyme